MPESRTKRIDLVVDGMTCEWCVKSIREYLLRVKGVRNVEIDLEQHLVRCEYETILKDTDIIVKTIIDAGKNEPYMHNFSVRFVGQQV